MKQAIFVVLEVRNFQISKVFSSDLISGGIPGMGPVATEGGPFDRILSKEGK